MVIGGTAGPITAGLRPSDAWSACGERTDAGQKEPIAAMTKRQHAATATLAVRGRIRRPETANPRDRLGRVRRLRAAMASARRAGSTSASTFSAPTLSG